ncbi:hypothetical protein AGMMS4952_15380 [Spirochaetia bacterium]|nr:hypothetical protein AGMMS4952_15380 [Spirochaetia bacterium]
MADNGDYLKTLTEVLAARAEWLEKSELGKLKEEFRTFHTAFASLYNLCLKRGLLNVDPYKNEVKIGELAVPETEPFTDGDYKDKFSLRLSNYDNQLDFLVNFYPFSVDSLTVAKMKPILGLIKFIDWTRLNAANEAPNNHAMLETVNLAKKGADPMSANIISESVSRLSKTTGTILSYLKLVSDYNREAYKLDLRTRVLSGLSPEEHSVIPTVKKKFAAVMPGQPFYPDLMQEIIKEDSAGGKALRDNVIKQMTPPVAKEKALAPQVDFKGILIIGLNAIGSVYSTMAEVAGKLDENAALLENQKQGFWDKLKRLIQQILNKEPDPTVFDLEYIDPVKGMPVKQKVDFNHFRSEMDRKSKTLTALASRSGAAFTKMQSMTDEQLMGMLEKNIRDVQTIHKILAALDDFFKIEAGRENRSKVKGIKVELGVMKNAIVKANQLRHEYSAQKEEEEQMKKLGIVPGAAPSAAVVAGSGS